MSNFCKELFKIVLLRPPHPSNHPSNHPSLPRGRKPVNLSVPWGWWVGGGGFSLYTQSQS